MNGKLDIQTALRNNKTILKGNFMSPPFKLADITEDKSSSVLELMIMSSSPGTLDKDEFKINIEVNESCRLILKTQSYQRLFDMQETADQEVNVTIKENAFFSFIPHPTVPHKNADYTSINNIHLKKSSTLIWGEILTCGRKLNNEVFLFKKIHSITNVFCDDKLIIRENLLMQPASIDLSSIGQLEGYTHQASLIFFNQNFDIEKIKNTIFDLLNDKPTMNFGVSNAGENTIITRILGHHAEELFEALNEINFFLSSYVLKNKIKESV
jgi:urease accessory protein